jgi:hypothetical protein
LARDAAASGVSKNSSEATTPAVVMKERPGSKSHSKVGALLIHWDCSKVNNMFRAHKTATSFKTATIVNPGDLRNWRRANRRSCSRVVMVGLRATMWLHGKKGNSRARV